MGEVVPLHEEATFDDFWTLWPRERRVCKKNAEAEWRKISPERYAQILTALAGWRNVWASRGEWEFVPHPHRWLKNERWEDELPAMAHASHKAAVLPERGDKGQMPQYVRDMIASLRKR